MKLVRHIDSKTEKNGIYKFTLGGCLFGEPDRGSKIVVPRSKKKKKTEDKDGFDFIS